MNDYIAIAVAWRDVRVDGLPPCDSETVYVGANAAGYLGCFNAVYTDDCWMEGPEENTHVLSGLRFWRVIDRPGAALSVAPIEPAQDREDALRYRWLRDRDIDTINVGGVFAGMTPDNVVMNGDELDAAIDAARQAPKEQTK